MKTFFFFCCLLIASVTAQPVPPNIVVFLVDDMGIMDTSVPFLTDDVGQPKKFPLNEWYRTPNMERLANQGIRFNQFSAMSVCSPTRVSILTGQNAARHHVTNWIDPDRNNRGSQGPKNWNWEGLRKNDITLPLLLQQNGYRTIHVGKGHFGPNQTTGSNPANLGFDVNIGGTSYGSPGSYYGQKNYGKGGNKAIPHLEKYHGTDTFLTDALSLEANAQIDASINAKKPFFLYFAHYAVHAPLQADPRYASHYVSSNKSNQAQIYATLIESMDHSLGMLLDHLNQAGVAESTFVIFLGDNGSDAPLGDPHSVGSSAPLRGKKGSHYEGGTRVPFIAGWAKLNPENTHQQTLPIPAGVVQAHMASVEDLFPTVLDIAKAKAPAAHVIDGQNLRALLTGKADPGHRDRFLMHFPHEHRSNYWSSLRDGEWKVIFHYLPQKTESQYQLFHLTVDPYEKNDLATKDPQTLRIMMQKLVDELEKHGAQYPLDAEGKALRPLLPHK